MSIDLNFWKCKEGAHPEPGEVYKKVCCDRETARELEVLPIEGILERIGEEFADWDRTAPDTYEKADSGSFQISAVPQAVRVDCYGMSRSDRKRFSAVLSEFQCPLYDPQLGIRFDQILLRLHEEAAEYRQVAEQEIAKLLPGLEITVEPVDHAEGPQPLTATKKLQLEIYIHRAKTLTKVTANIFAGPVWASRPCQCKTAQLAEPDAAREILSGLIGKSIGRAVGDLFERTDLYAK